MDSLAAAVAAYATSIYGAAMLAPTPWSWLGSLQPYTPIITALTTLFAVFFGPLVQIWIARRQIKTAAKIARKQQRATVVSNNRVRWIEEFRREVAEFISACHGHEFEKHSLLNAEEEKDEKKIEHYNKAVDVSLLRVNILLHTIRLKLDPDDPRKQHDGEIWALTDKLDKLNVHDFDSLELFEADFSKVMEPLRIAVRAKLKGEWHRVESLK